MSGSWRISRRMALKGLGVSVALPWMEAMTPGVSLGATSVTPPKRMAFLYVPNGMHMPDWTPAAEGTGYELTDILEPLAPFRDDFSVMTGLTLDKARANGDGGGDHARALSAFLTCSQPRKTHGIDIKVGISVDQVAAQKVGTETRFPSLEIGCDAGPQSGNCDSGYSCAYSGNISWRSESTPQGKEINPRLVFERLFVDPAQAASQADRVQRQRYRKSVLDLVRDDAARLQRKVGANDQRKLDEYLTAVREVEQRISRVESATPEGFPVYAKPAGIPHDYQEHLRLMCDMLALAFQTDATRIATFVFANEGSNRSYPFIQVPEAHHELSHHGKNAEKQAKIKKINLFHVAQLAYLIEKLKGIREGEGTLLDNCMLVYGSGISDGDRHNHDDLPILLFGKGGGTLKPGRHVRFEKETPIANFYLALLERFGVHADKLGDSTDRPLELNA